MFILTGLFEDIAKTFRKDPIGVLLVLFLMVGVFVACFHAMRYLQTEIPKDSDQRVEELLQNTELRIVDLKPLALAESYPGVFAVQSGSGDSATYEYRVIRGSGEELVDTASMANAEVTVKTAASDQDPQVLVRSCGSSPQDSSKPYVDKPTENWGPQSQESPLCADQITLVVPEGGIVE